MIVFEILKKYLSGHILISIECKAWARNIPYNAEENVGVVQFELFIDWNCMLDQRIKIKCLCFYTGHGKMFDLIF